MNFSSSKGWISLKMKEFKKWRNQNFFPILFKNFLRTYLYTSNYAYFCFCYIELLSWGGGGNYFKMK